jgi:hypothetical protein
MHPRELISDQTLWADLEGPHELELGGCLGAVRVAYGSWGRLDRDGGNAARASRTSPFATSPRSRAGCSTVSASAPCGW